MTRPKKWIPLTDIKGLSTLVGENKTQKEIVEYYSEHGLHYDQTTISRCIKKMRNYEPVNAKVLEIIKEYPVDSTKCGFIQARLDVEDYGILLIDCIPTIKVGEYVQVTKLSVEEALKAKDECSEET